MLYLYNNKNKLIVIKLVIRILIILNNILRISFTKQFSLYFKEKIPKYTARLEDPDKKVRRFFHLYVSLPLQKFSRVKE